MQRLLLVVMAVCLAIALAQTTTPIMMFAKENYFNAAKMSSTTLNNAQLTEVFTDLFAGAATPTNPNVLNAIESAQIPSTVFVWSQAGLTTQQSSNVLALYAPNTEYEAVQGAVSMYLPNSVQDDADTFYRSLLVTSEALDFEVDANTTCQTIVDQINAGVAAAATATKNTLVRAKVANIADFSKFNQCLDQINAALDTAAAGKYVTIVQGSTGADVYKTLAFTPQDTTTAVGATARADGQVGPRYVTSQTLVALFVVITLLVFLLFGVSRLMQVEGPLRFPLASHLPPATREY